MCEGVSSAGMSVYLERAWCMRRPEEGAGSSGTGNPEDCEQPCRC